MSESEKNQTAKTESSGKQEKKEKQQRSEKNRDAEGGEKNERNRRSSRNRRRRPRRRKNKAPQGPLSPVEGYLWLRDKGQPLLLDAKQSFIGDRNAPIVPNDLIRPLHLETGLHLQALLITQLSSYDYLH